MKYVHQILFLGLVAKVTLVTCCQPADLSLMHAEQPDPLPTSNVLKAVELEVEKELKMISPFLMKLMNVERNSTRNMWQILDPYLLGLFDDKNSTADADESPVDAADASSRSKRSPPPWTQSLLVQGLSQPFCRLFGTAGCLSFSNTNITRCQTGYVYDYTTRRCRQYRT